MGQYLGLLGDYWVTVKPLVVQTGELPTQKLKSYRATVTFWTLHRQTQPFPPWTTSKGAPMDSVPLANLTSVWVLAEVTLMITASPEAGAPGLKDMASSLLQEGTLV